jgi:PAS domain S-box-containing protein
MSQEEKTKEELLSELEELRRKVAELEKGEGNHKEIDDKLLVANERLHYLLSSSTAVIYSAKTSDDYGATFISSNVSEIVGYEPNEFLENSKFWFDHVHPEDRLRVSQEVQKIFEKEYHAYEYRFKCKDGRFIWVNDEMKLVKDVDGNPIEIIGFWVDITERKQVEEALQESEQKYRILFETSPEGILITDIETKEYEYANPALCKMLGYSVEEIRNLKVFDLHPEDKLDGIVSKFEAHSKGEITRAENVPFLRKDGTTVYVDISGRPTIIDGKKCSVGFLRDNTERKKAEESLQESEEKYRILAEDSPTGIFISDPEKFIYVNNRLCEITGYQTQELLKMKDPITALFVPEEQERIMGIAINNFKGTNPLPSVEARGLRKNKEEYTLRLKSSLIELEGRKVLQGNIEDITERKKAEEELRQFEQIVSSSADMMALLNEDFIYLAANKAYLEAFNLPNEKMVGYSVADVFGKEFFKEIIKPHADKCLVGEKIRYQEWFDFPAIGKKYMEINYYPYLGNDHKIKGFVVNGRDITERKQAEEHLRFQSLLLNQSSDYIITSDLEGNISFANESMAKALGSKPQELLGTSVNIFHDELGETTNLEIMEKTMNEGHWNGEKTMLMGDGRKRIIDLHTQIIVNEKSQPNGLFAIGRDVTDRKLAEESLIESEGKYRYLVENSNEVIYSVDEEGTVTYISPFIKHLLGYEPQELIGQNFSRFIHKEDLEFSKTRFQENLVKKNAPGIYKVLTRTGENRWVQTSSRPIKKGDRIVGVQGILTDVTERRLAEDALRESEEKHRTLFETMAQGVVYQEASGNIISANSAAERILGLTLDQMMGRTSMDPRWKAVREDGSDFPGDTHPAMVALKTGKEVQNVIMGVYHPEKDEHVWINVNATPQFRPEEGKPYQVYTTFEDITHHKESEERIITSLHEKEVLLKEIHHRVKNNLQVISSILNLQSKYIQDKSTFRMFQDSQNRVQTMALIHEKMYKSKDLTKIKFEDYLRDLVYDLFSTLRINSSVITPKIDVQGVYLGIDRAIPCGLIVNELVSNSMKHAFPEGQEGEIEIDLISIGEKDISMRISDNGVGFPNDVDFKNTESLGLQLVNTLVDQLEGTIELSRSSGTTFNITFPKYDLRDNNKSQNKSDVSIYDDSRLV